MAKTQGRGSAEWMVVGVLVAVYCCSLLASSTTLTVGDSQGWTIGPNYTTWAAGQTFTTGDDLFFPYTKGAHDVVEVDKTGYDACSATSAINTYTDGNTSVTLTSTGAHYFLCSFPSHCTSGMKLAVTVAAGATPAPAPSTSVGTPPPTPTTTAPAPATTTPSSSTPPSSSAPTPTSTAPVPSPATPTPTPAPAPTIPSPSPASTPSPTSSSSPTSPASSSPSSSTTSPPPPPSAATSLPFRASLAAVLLCLSAAFLAL